MDNTSKKITHEILKAAVSQEHGIAEEAIQMEELAIKPGSKVGDGFVCEIKAVSFIAIVNGEKIEKNYIAKYAPEGPQGDFVREMKAVDHELRAYTFLIPQMQSLRKASNLKPMAFASCFYASAQQELIILENLKSRNFQVVPKKPQPLTLHGVKLVLEELASFHATSHHFVNTFPGGVDALNKEYQALFQEIFFDIEKQDDFKVIKMFLGMITKMFGAAIVVAKNFGSEDLAKRVEDYQKIIKPEMEKLFLKKWQMSYITHGDAWFNNFLFRFSADDHVDPKEVMILDLQSTRMGRPGIELAYFFCSSTSPKQRKDHFQDLLRHYYNSFFINLKSLGDNSEPFFSFDDLVAEYDECYPFGIVLGCAHSQALIVREDSDAKLNYENPDDEAGTSEMMEELDRHVLANAKRNPEYRKIILELVQEAAEKHVI